MTTVNKSDHPESEKSAKHIYKEYYNNSSSDVKLISIIGAWGTGKSTIKKKLKNKITDKNTIVVTYDALQFEEISQVTSELYNTIAKSIKSRPFNLALITKLYNAIKKAIQSRPFNLTTQFKKIRKFTSEICIKNKFKAIAQLKKKALPNQYLPHKFGLVL